MLLVWLRRPLYIRDDDYRLSFAYGNFATLSNLKERDFARILEYRLSPLYVSVHATPWEARKKLLNNPKVPDILAQLTRLAEGGIQFHGQMVIVPGLNDGEVLEASLTDLWNMGEACLSVALVPVGLTQFSHLYTGETMNRENATRLLEAAERWGARARSERGETWVVGSDELYLLAGAELPGPDFYGDYSQIENGVGSITALRERVAEGLDRLPRLDGKTVGVVTGISMAPLMPPLLEATVARHRRAIRTHPDGEFAVRAHDHDRWRRHHHQRQPTGRQPRHPRRARRSWRQRRPGRHHQPEHQRGPPREHRFHPDRRR